MMTLPTPKTAGAPRLVIAAVLVTFAIAAYAGVGDLGFVYDDRLYILENTHVTGGPTTQNLRWALTAFYADNWHPLTWLSHQFDVALFGLHPRGHHLVNLGLHAITSGLLFLLLAQLSGALWRSAFVAALLALHPLHVESVAWVAERKNLLSSLLMLLTLWAYLWYVAAPRRRLRLLPVAGGLAAGLMAKPMLVTMPFVLLLLDFWPLGRMAWAGRRPGQAPFLGAAGILPLVAEKLPLFALSALACVVTYAAQQAGGAMVRVSHYPLSARLANAAVSYGRYLGKMLWPADLAAIYPYPAAGWPPAFAAAAAVALAAVTVLTLAQWRRRPYLATGWLWYLGMMVPVLGLVQVGYQAMADRYAYLPLIGVFLCVAWGVPEIASRVRLRSGVLAGVATLVLVALAARTRAQVPVWRDDGTLFGHARAVTTDNFVAEYNVGNILLGQGRLDESIDHFREAVRVKPDYFSAHNNLAVALALRGRAEEALSHYREAVRLNPAFTEARVGLGTVLRSLGRFDQAAEQYRRALELDPGNADVLYNLGVALALQGKYDEAAVRYREALRIRPGFPEASADLELLSAGPRK